MWGFLKPHFIDLETDLDRVCLEAQCCQVTEEGFELRSSDSNSVFFSLYLLVPSVNKAALKSMEDCIELDNCWYCG